MTPFTDDQLAQAVVTYFEHGIQDNHIAYSADLRAITQIVFHTVFGYDVRTWPADWQETWDTIERRLASKRLRITVTFEDEP